MGEFKNEWKLNLFVGFVEEILDFIIHCWFIDITI